MSDMAWIKSRTDAQLERAYDGYWFANMTESYHQCAEEIALRKFERELAALVGMG